MVALLSPTGRRPRGGGVGGPRIVLSNAAVSELALDGDLIGFLSVSGADGATYSFSLTATDGGRFEISGSPGDELRVAAPLDVLGGTSRSITVQATNGSGTLERTFGIAVTDVAAPQIQLSGSAVDENSEAGTIVGTFSVTGGAGIYSFHLTDDAAGLFDVGASPGDNTLRVAGELDFETAATHNITVEATNGFHTPISRTLAITVNDVDDAVDIGGIPGLVGFWTTDDATMFTTSAGSTPATADGARVGRWAPQFGPGLPLLQANDSIRPTLRRTGGLNYLSFADGMPSSDGYYMDTANTLDLSDPYLYFAMLALASTSANSQNLASMGVDGGPPWGTTWGVLFGQRDGSGDTWRAFHNFNDAPTTTGVVNGENFIWETMWSPAGVELALNGVTQDTASFSFDPEPVSPNTQRFRIAAGGGGANLPVEFHVGRIYGLALVSGAGAPISADDRVIIRDALLAAAGL